MELTKQRKNDNKSIFRSLSNLEKGKAPIDAEKEIKLKKYSLEFFNTLRD